MDAFSAAELYKSLKTQTLGRHAVVLDTVDSTNLEVRRLLDKGSSEGEVVIADRQTLGRGRRGRHWVSEAGCGLWMSFAAKPRVPPAQTQQMTLAAGVAVCRAIEAVTENTVKPLIKWPNDIIVEGKKLCGILCESFSGSPYPPLIRGDAAVAAGGISNVIVGIGVNTSRPQNSWDEAEGIAVSLEESAGRLVPRIELAAAILNEMEPLLDAMRAGGFAEIAEEYRKRMLPVGSEVVIVDGAWNPRRGRIEGVEDSGELLVRLESGEIERIVSGEISLRGVGGYV
jgi:BirA family biotin operon repressor/biotin-[acetyl-CoA-carboxylase] ligase